MMKEISRSYDRPVPSRIAKKIFIFCEGRVREYDYFEVFANIDSRVVIQPYKLQSSDDSTPTGLKEISIKKLKTDIYPYNDFCEGDEVWIVSDRDYDKEDSREKQIEDVKNFILDNPQWKIVISNPCFEVWLYYHFYENKPQSNEFDGNIKVSKDWKRFLNKKIGGGFNSKYHSVFIQDAIMNSKRCMGNDNPVSCSSISDVYLLGESIVDLLGKDKVELLKKTRGRMPKLDIPERVSQ